MQGISCASYFGCTPEAEFRESPLRAMWHWDISVEGTIRELDEDGNERVFSIPAVEVTGL